MTIEVRCCGLDVTSKQIPKRNRHRIAYYECRKEHYLDNCRRWELPSQRKWQDYATKPDQFVRELQQENGTVLQGCSHPKNRNQPKGQKDAAGEAENHGILGRHPKDRLHPSRGEDHPKAIQAGYDRCVNIHESEPTPSNHVLTGHARFTSRSRSVTQHSVRVGPTPGRAQHQAVSTSMRYPVFHRSRLY